MSAKRFLMLSALHVCFALAAIPAAAQTRPPVQQPPCADTASVPYRERVAIDLVYSGTNRREMWTAIWWAGTTATRCIVEKASLPTADTSMYGVLQINALDGGGYEIATSLAGPRAQRQRCRNARAAIVTGDTPIVWGVLLAKTVPRFVECVVEARGNQAGPSR